MVLGFRVSWFAWALVPLVQLACFGSEWEAEIGPEMADFKKQKGPGAGWSIHTVICGGYRGIYCGDYIGITEKKMEATIYGCGAWLSFSKDPGWN